MGMKGGNTEGEIVQVQGGHIVRATGRKDRHSKVYTSKGPRDRRVRLSAHTAIQFYDVQDRLGYDRPSKAVDWLIKKAKSSIDKLAELPPWQVPNFNNNINNNNNAAAMEVSEPNVEMTTIQDQSESTGYSFQIHRQLGDHHHNTNNNDSTFMSPPPPPQPQHSLDTDAIADTIKSFFPTSTNNNNNTAASAINFQNYVVPGDIIARSTNPTEDLGLSLHTADHHHHQNLFSGGSEYDSNFGRMVAWNHHHGTTSPEARGGGGFFFNSSLLAPQQQQQAAAAAQMGAHQQFHHSSSSYMHHHHQSSNSVRGNWDDIPIGKLTHEIQQSNNSIFGIMPAGFSIPARIHGQDQHHHNHHDATTPSSPNNSHRR